MKIVPVKVQGEGKSKWIYALLDEGSTITLINNKIIKDIGLEYTNTNIVLRSIGNESSISIATKKVNLHIQGAFQIFPIENVLVVKNLSLPVQKVSTELAEFWAQKTGIYIDSYESYPDMLISQDHCSLIITEEYHVITNKLILSKCLLGWAIHGCLQNNNSAQIYNLNIDNKSKKCDCQC